MSRYTVKRMVNEATMTNVFLQALDGKTERTFAYQCGDMKIGDTAYMDSMHNDFIAARAVREQMHRIDKIKLYDIDCYAMNNATGKYIIIIGLIIILIGVIIYFFHDKLNWIGKLPGDIRVEKENFKFYFPITTMILLSLAITLIINLVKKFL